MVTAEQQLLLCCARSRPGAKVLADIRRLTEQNLNWAEVTQEADRQRVVSLVHLNLERVGKSNQYLRDTYHAIATQNIQITLGAGKITGWLKSAGISCICLKGPALAISAYGSCSLRQFGDLDLFVQRSDLKQAVAVLGDKGFAFSGDHQPPPGADILADRSSYHVAMSGTAGLVIELHWATSAQFFRLVPNGTFWSNSRTVSSAGGELQALPLEEELVFLCLHASRHFWSRLIWISDIAEHIEAHPELDWTRVFSIARRQGATPSLILGLKLAQDLLDAQFPAPVSARLATARKLEPLARQLAIRVFEPKHPLFGAQTGLQTLFYRLSLHDHFVDKWQAILYSRPRLKGASKDESVWTRPIRLFRVYVPHILSFRKSQAPTRAPDSAE